jgi:AsmA protein
LSRIIIFLVALVAVGAGVVFIAPLFISTDALQKKALAQVENATGYRVRVAGPFRIAFFPSLDLVASDVGVAQSASGGPAEFATARTLRFGLMLSGLLRGQVQLTEVTLVDPVITLPLPSRNASAGAPDAEPGSGGGLGRLSFDKLVIHNGTVVLPPPSDGSPGKQIKSLNAEASIPSANGPLSFDADADYDGDRIRATGSIGSFAHFLDGGPAPVELALQTPDLPDGIALAGTASYKDSTFKLAQFSAQSGPHALSGNATYRDDALTITQGRFDDTPFAGTAHLADDALTVDMEVVAEDKPVRLTGSLSKFKQFLAGGEAPITLGIVAPDYLPDKVTLDGVASYKDDALTLQKFTAAAGDDTISGAAVYKDDVLSLSQIAASLGDQAVTGNVTYKYDTVDLDLAVDLKGKPAKVTGSIAGIEQLTSGQPATLKLAVDAPDRLPAKASVEGAAVYKDDTLILTGFEAVSGESTLTGNGTYKDGILVLDPIKAVTGSQTLSGAVTAKFAGDVPQVDATLTATGSMKATAAPKTQVEGGDVPAAPAKTSEESNPIASPPGDETKGAAQAPVEAAKNPIASPPGSETEIVVAPPTAGAASPAGAPAPAAQPKPAPAAAPRTSGFGWRVDKLGLLALKDVNATVNLTLNQFAFEGIRIAAATLKATLTGGKLSAETKNLRAYGGGGSMTLVLDASGAAPAHRLNLSVAGLDAYPFLKDVAGFTTIEGKAAIALNLSASGDSERAMVSSLNGTAKFEFTDGALRGLNVGNMLRNLATGILTGWQYKQETKTVFNKLSASFKIAKGQATTDDLRMVGPLISVGGAGTVDLPAKRLKFRVNPFMLASVQSQSGKNNMLGFPVPIAVSGPWDNPAIYPDIAGILENPVAAYQQLNKLGGGLISMPANLLGINTGEGGLVEKGVALPGAITKGVIGGIGQALGGKKSGTAKPQGEKAAVPAGPAQSTAPAAAEPAPAQSLNDAPAQQQAAPKKDKAPQAAPNQMLDNLFGN